MMEPAVEAVLREYQLRMDAERPILLRALEDGTLGQRLDEFLLPVGPASGQLINLLAKSLSTPTILELGTSYGYSGIWLAEAARANGGRLITMELSETKSNYAREMAKKAGLADHVDYGVGDALKMIAEVGPGIDFVLVDLWKDLYVPCLDAFYPKLRTGAIVVADNMLEPAMAVRAAAEYRKAVRAKPKMTSILVPVGAGLEISRFDA
jgi:predicted O-methyltransferase YrrM